MDRKLLGDWLRERRRAGNVRPRELADAVGVDATRIAQIESGTERPSPELLQRIAAYFHVDVSEIPPADGAATVVPELASATAGARPLVRVALGVLGGAALASAVFAGVLAVGLLQVAPPAVSTAGTSSSPAALQASATATPVAPTPTATPAPSPSPEPGTAIRVPPGVQPIPVLPDRVEFAPEAPWRQGDAVTVQTQDGEGAYLRPYPVADNTVAEPVAALPEGARLEVASNHRWRVNGEYWRYVRVADPGFANRPVFGWIREDFLQPVAREGPAE